MLKDSFRGHTTETPTPVIVDELMMADVMLADGCCFYYIFWREGQSSNDKGFSDFPFVLSYLRYDFGKGRVGKRHQVEFTLYNQGDIPATARFDAWILPKNGRHLGFGKSSSKSSFSGSVLIFGGVSRNMISDTSYD